MPRLTLPALQIDIYKDGFEPHKALLDRSAEGAQLSHLVGAVDDPMTIAVDGAWGAGKSHFLQCWVGEYLKTADEAEVVYFDAFKHDYLDDPLIALTGVLVDRFDDPDCSTAPTATAKLKKRLRKAAPKLGRLVLRMVVSNVTAGIVNRADDWVGSDDADAKDEAQERSKALTGTADAAAQDAIDRFWQAEEGKRAAVEAFRAALRVWSKPDDKGHPTRRLVIVVDELDRCRPDYALNVLEIIKHFFDVAGVTFVLGTNMRAMQNHVIARYGAGVDAALYLQKFVQVRMRLGEKTSRSSNSSKSTDYFHAILQKMGVYDGYGRIIEGYLPNIRFHDSLTLRGLQEVARLCVLTPFPNHLHDMRVPVLIGGLILLKALRPKVLEKIKNEECSWAEVREELGLKGDLLEARHTEGKILEAWQLCFQDQKTSEFWQEYLGDEYHSVINSYDRSTLRELHDRYIGTISIKELK